MEIKEKERKKNEAQEMLNWAITHLEGSIKCKVIDYKHENYRVQFLKKDDKPILENYQENRFKLSQITFPLGRIVQLNGN